MHIFGLDIMPLLEKIKITLLAKLFNGHDFRKKKRLVAWYILSADMKIWNLSKRLRMIDWLLNEWFLVSTVYTIKYFARKLKQSSIVDPSSSDCFRSCTKCVYRLCMQNEMLAVVCITPLRTAVRKILKIA